MEPFTVPIHSVGLPETYHAIDRLGITMWSNAHGIAEAGLQAGVNVTWVGTGTPVPFPDPPPRRTFDVAVIEENKWTSQAIELAERMGPASVLRIGRVESVYSLCRELSQARILLWPSRIEGMSRIAREARGVGTVPVALDTNPFATPEDHGGGVVLVPDLDSIVTEASALLADPRRLERLEREAVASVRTQANWDVFVQRVSTALDRLVVRPTAHGRQVLGDGLYEDIRDIHVEAATQLGLLENACKESADRNQELEAERDAAIADRDIATAERDVAAQGG
jgi:hypothetical protein